MAVYDHPVERGGDDDAVLMRAAQSGDVDAFAEIVRRHERRLSVVVRRILDDVRDVEEAVQDAFLQAWRNLDRYRGEAAVFTWLYRIGVNEGLARTRRRRLTTVDLEAPAAAGVHDLRPDTQPEAMMEATEAREQVRTALGRLPFDYREAVVLRDLVGLTNEEVAAALGLTIPAAKSRIHRGRLQLRELLEPHVEP